MSLSDKASMLLEAIPIYQDGECPTTLPLHALAAEVRAHTVNNYIRTGYEMPWIGYLTFINNINVGACGFKAPPLEDRVEIAYFTFPEFEGRGYGRQAAAKLIEIARRERPLIQITAQTLPQESASTSILKNLGFAKVRIVNDKEDGPVWEWEFT